MSEITVHHGDSREVLRTLPDASVDSVVCDPPYALVSIGKRFGADGAAPAQAGATGVYQRASAGFMGQQWDTGETAFAIDFWAEVLRVLKPGGHLVAFGGTRTYHRLACAIEDAGFEIRDMTAWLYGSGFPKSHDVTKSIDRRSDWSTLASLQAAVRTARKALGISQSEAARRAGLIGPDESLGGGGYMWFETGNRIPTREQWPALKGALGLGDELDGCFEEVEREVTGEVTEWTDRTNYAITSKDGKRRDKPASPLAQEWAGWGTALKPALEPVVLARKPLIGTVALNVVTHGTGALNIDGCRIDGDPKQWSTNTGGEGWGFRGEVRPASIKGRWPANVMHDGSDEVLEAFPDAGGAQQAVRGDEPSDTTGGVFGKFSARASSDTRDGGGSAARFFKSAEMGQAELIFWRTNLMLWTWNPELANTADRASCLSNEAVDFALNDAVTSLFGDHLQSSLEPSTTATPRELSLLLKSAIEAILSSADGLWPAPLHDALTQAGGRASVVAQSAPTVTTMITISHWKSDGSAAPVIFSITPKSKGPGDAVSAGKRFWYSAKADSEDRLGSDHPTVKPVALMAYLCRLVTPPGGTVLDPFAGTGTTGLAAMNEGFDCILIEREERFVQTIHRRLAWARGDGQLTILETARKLDPTKAAGEDLPLFAGGQTDA